MNTNQPIPSDLCECGHNRAQHSGSGFVCYGRIDSCSCACKGFKPAKSQPTPVPVSEADVEKVAKEIYMSKISPYSNIWENLPDTVKWYYRFFSRYHLTQLATVREENKKLKALDKLNGEYIEGYQKKEIELRQTNRIFRRDNERLRGALEKILRCDNEDDYERVAKTIATQALSRQPAVTEHQRGGD